MKKLIDELEVARDNADSIKEAQAVQLCINIARAHNPWHEVTELPEHGTVLTHLSIVVWCTDGESRSIGYYNYRSGMWYAEGLILPVIKWTYLPEGKS